MRKGNKGQNRIEMRKRKRIIARIVKVCIILFLLFVLGGMTFAVKMLADAKKLVDSSYRPRETTTSMDGKELTHLNDNVDPVKDPFCVLILGVDDNDERNLGSSRTDSMILITVNPSDSKVSMVSIPRDTYTSISTTKFTGMDKINAAYSYGKDEAAIQAVQDLMKVPINYYLTVDFKALEEIVDALGGITVDVPMDINEHYAGDNSGKTLIPKGTQNLNGEQALIYARVRKIDNDIERGKRQQIVIEQVIKKAAEVGSITKYSKVLQALNGHMWTDMKADTMMSIAQSGLNKDYGFDSYIFSWEGFDYNGASMVALHEDSLNYISHKLNVSLGLEKSDYRDEAGYVFESNGVISTKTYPSDGGSYTNSPAQSYNQYGNNQTYPQTDNYNQGYYEETYTEPVYGN